MKPSPDKYHGAKGGAGVAELIIGQMPPHSVYVEPFLGTGRIFHRKRPAALSILMDQRGDLLEDAVCEAAPSVRVQTHEGDALQILPTLHLPADALTYADPPYLLQTRGGRRYYQHELEDTQHVALLQVLKTLPGFVMLSGLRSPMYEAALAGWRRIDYPTRWHRKNVIESLWLNFPEPATIHDWRFAGIGYRERLTLKRQAARWVNRLARMAPRRRGFLMAAITEAQAAAPSAGADRQKRRGDPETPKPARQARLAEKEAAGQLALFSEAAP